MSSRGCARWVSETLADVGNVSVNGVRTEHKVLGDPGIVQALRDEAELRETIRLEGNSAP